MATITAENVVGILSDVFESPFGTNGFCVKDSRDYPVISGGNAGIVVSGGKYRVTLVVEEIIEKKEK